jgi:putative RecB family exonuclease
LERLFDLPRGLRSLQDALNLIAPAYQSLAARDAGFAELFEDPAAREEWMESVRGLVRAYFDLEDPNLLEPDARELFIEAPLAGGELRLRGCIDRLDAAPATGALRVVDYKTGKAPPARFMEEPRFQLRCYALALWRLRGVIPARVQLIYLGSGDIVHHDPDEGELIATEAQLLALWQSIAAAAARNDWPAARGPLCPWCAFQSLCPAFGGTTPPVSQEGLTRLGLPHPPTP